MLLSGLSTAPMDARSRSTDAAVFRFILRCTSFLIRRVASGTHNVLLRDKTLKQTCPSLALSCEQQFTAYRATARVSNLINDIGTQALMLPSRPTEDSCTDFVSTNSFTIQIGSPASTCS